APKRLPSTTASGSIGAGSQGPRTLSKSVFGHQTRHSFNLPDGPFLPSRSSRMSSPPLPIGFSSTPAGRTYARFGPGHFIDHRENSAISAGPSLTSVIFAFGPRRGMSMTRYSGVGRS